MDKATEKRIRGLENENADLRKKLEWQREKRYKAESRVADLELWIQNGYSTGKIKKDTQ